ncbi:Carbohydrate-binding module family 12 protein [Mycena kentingensis (nom. inval.)]|nr:Carbohydrate-binding module family 12 protein [Mycena kentingensis (nom. inval.)]
MTLWQPGTQYNTGDVVEYEGVTYKNIQAHRRRSDWAPPIVPALWGRMQGGGDHHESHGHHSGHQQQHYQPQQHDEKQGYIPPPPQGQTVQPHPEERKQNWWDLSDERKHQLEVGGGLLAGAGLLAGGFAAYKHHEKNEDEKKAQLWSMQNWLHDAEQRTLAFRQNGPRSAATWILNKGKSIPDNAILVGKEKSWNLYICRAFFDGGVQVGKASDVFKKGAVIGYENEEHHLDTYEILIGDMNGLRWVPAEGRLNVNNLGYKPVEGGRENDGTPLYIAQAPHKDATHPGKASEKLDGAYIPFDGEEVCVRSYRVLCYA